MKKIFKSSDFMDYLQQNKDLGEHYDLKWKMDRALSDAIDGIQKDDDMELDDKKSEIHKCLDDHCKCMKAWHDKYLDITQPREDDEEDDDDSKALAVIHFLTGKALTQKEGRMISAATKKKLDRAIGHIKDANGHAAGAMESHEKGLGILADLGQGRYWNDTNVPHPVGSGSGSGAPPQGTEDTTNPVGGGKDAKVLAEILKSFQKIA